MTKSALSFQYDKICFPSLVGNHQSVVLHFHPTQSVVLYFQHTKSVVLYFQPTQSVVLYFQPTQSVVLNLDGLCKPTSTWRRGATKHIVLCRHDRLGQNKLLFFQAKGEQKAMQTATNTPGQGRVGALSTSQHYLGNSLSCLFGNDNLATTSASRV